MCSRFLLNTVLLFSLFFVGCAHFESLFSDFYGDIPVPSWDKTTKASCWQGNNAEIRHMNILSPHMSDDMFKSRVRWAKDRGCNTIHVYVGNEGDGEYAGYCIYGNKWDWVIDENYVKVMKGRIEYISRQGFAVVVWLFADDSSRYNKTASTNFDRYLQDVSGCGLFERASIIVVGLELDEYYSAVEVSRLVTATRKYYNGMVATHETSYRYNYAYVSDIVFYQVDPSRSIDWIRSEAFRVKRDIGGKPLNFFELSRHEDRERSQAALDGGANMIGNW